MPAKKKDENTRGREQALWRKSLAGNTEDEPSREREHGKKYLLVLVPRTPVHLAPLEEEYDPTSRRRAKVTSLEPIDISPSRLSERRKTSTALVPYSPRRTAVVSHHGFERNPSAHARSDFEREVLHGLSTGVPLWQLMHAAHTPAQRRQLENFITNGKPKRPGFRTPREVDLNALREQADRIIASRKPSARIKQTISHVGNWRKRVRDYLRK